MITFLFWNIQKKPLQHRIARIADRAGVDVLVLAECAATSGDVLSALNAPLAVPNWSNPPAGSERLKLFTRLPATSAVDRFTEIADRMTIREVRPPSGQSFLLACVHLPSKYNWKDRDHDSWIHFLVSDLERIEGAQPGRVVLVGDLNMDPFDAAIVGGFGLHALSSRRAAEWRDGRIVQGRPTSRTFFNPMWSLLGDRGGAPAGTFYRHGAEPVNHFWHALDQVLLRPSLAGYAGECRDSRPRRRRTAHSSGARLAGPRTRLRSFAATFQTRPLSTPMTTDPLNLWPDEIRVAPLTPLRLLNLQAKGLEEKTQGRLTAEVITSSKGSPVTTPDEWGPHVVHRFEIVAPALGGYRHQVAICVHQQEFAYPVLVLSGQMIEDGNGDFAASQDEFVRIMRGILNSKQIVGVISSLLARIAETEVTSVPA